MSFVHWLRARDNSQNRVGYHLRASRAPKSLHKAYVAPCIVRVARMPVVEERGRMGGSVDQIGSGENQGKPRHEVMQTVLRAMLGAGFQRLGKSGSVVQWSLILFALNLICIYKSLIVSGAKKRCYCGKFPLFLDAQHSISSLLPVVACIHS